MHDRHWQREEEGRRKNREEEERRIPRNAKNEWNNLFSLYLFLFFFCLRSLFLSFTQDALKKSVFPSDFRVFLLFCTWIFFFFPFLSLSSFCSFSFVWQKILSRTSLVQTEQHKEIFASRAILSQRRKSIDILIIIHGSKRSNPWCQLLCTQGVVLQCLPKFSSSLLTQEYLSFPLDSLFQQTLLTQERNGEREQEDLQWEPTMRT